MDIHNEIRPHSQLLKLLFAFKNKVGAVFKDILGLHEINHIAITRISIEQEIVIFSSTPALEFNLFNSELWHYDQTYHPAWFRVGEQTSWQSLYSPARYDELYYQKQIKHHYPIGSSFAIYQNNTFYIYSLASKQSCPQTQEIFATQYDDFRKIGLYCTNHLQDLFITCDNLASQSKPTELKQLIPI
ncbi:hypothetical protein [Legionella tunisiensis]|uniref:hypothetical protein n=1 Tax=Legionella tunisiensis TaxID=1034944 RepID=UPI0002EAFD7D|nr:hypothetical protein [Legionella tunisiensis]